MEYESAFLIRSPEKIIYKLSILLKKKCLLSVSFGNKGDSFITTILDIYIENNYLTFYHGPKEDAVDRLLNSPKITFKTEYLGIKVTFEAIKLAKIQHKGVSIFVIPVPDSLLWIETRDFYRVKSPVSTSSYCHMKLKNNDLISFKLYDISLSGFSMLIDSKDIADLIIPGDIFEQCKLVLAETDSNTISIKIIKKHIIHQKNFNRIEKIGCQFSQITPAFENIIQRYILKTERESR